MKTFFTLIAGLIATTASFAQTTPQMKVSVTDQNKVIVLIGEEKTKALVTIMDDNDNLVYSQQANIKNGLRESLDVSGLSEGVYHLAVSSADGLITKTILISKNTTDYSVAIR